MDLAIIIPAYKITYLDKALSSLASQTNKNFVVYVGDDSSPHDLYPVCQKYEDLIPLNYHRFDTNLGKISLVKQWERCVARMQNEKWLWVFSDDDIADPMCVEKFYEAIETTNSIYDVYRFNTTVINENGAFLSEAEPSPTVENAMDLAINILLGKRGNSMPDHIFSKKKYNSLNGFIDFAYAQSSDWATSIEYAYEKGLYTITGPKVHWRYSGENVSSQASKNKGLMLNGYMQFLDWVTKRFGPESEQIFGISQNEVIKASKRNFITLVKTHYKGIPSSSLFSIAEKLNNLYKMGYLKALKLCLILNLKVKARQIKSAIK